MLNKSVGVSYSKSETLDSSIDEWVKLEQVDIPNSSQGATIKDAVNMVAYVKQGNSAFDYIADSCIYVSINAGVVTVKLDLYVWPSDINLQYELKTSIGTISDGTKISKPRAFNVIFDKTNTKSLGFIFDGVLRPEMPFFSSRGGDITPDPTITIEGSNIVLSKKCTTVLRADVTAKGYLHTLSVELDSGTTTKQDKKTGAEVTVSGYLLPEPTITATWGDCDANSTECLEDHKDVLEMKIPSCVTDLLNACGDGEIPKTLEDMHDDEAKYIVYWNTCTGEVIDEFWRDPDE